MEGGIESLDQKQFMLNNSSVKKISVITYITYDTCMT